MACTVIPKNLDFSERPFGLVRTSSLHTRAGPSRALPSRKFVSHHSLFK